MPGFQYRQESMQLTPGMQIMLYTDGANEARNKAGQFFGATRLLRTASSLCPEDDPEFILRSVDRFVGSEPQSDDITVMLIRINKN